MIGLFVWVLCIVDDMCCCKVVMFYSVDFLVGFVVIRGCFFGDWVVVIRMIFVMLLYIYIKKEVCELSKVMFSCNMVKYRGVSDLRYKSNYRGWWCVGNYS